VESQGEALAAQYRCISSATSYSGTPLHLAHRDSARAASRTAARGPLQQWAALTSFG
jgi:hypothetical protein